MKKESYKQQKSRLQKRTKRNKIIKLSGCGVGAQRLHKKWDEKVFKPRRIVAGINN